MHREGDRCRVNHTDNRPGERYYSENVGKQGWLVRGWSSVDAGLQSFPQRWRQLVAGDAASVHARLQSFPWRWLRQLAARGAFSLPKHNSKKEGKKRYLYRLNQEHDSNCYGVDSMVGSTPQVGQRTQLGAQNAVEAKQNIYYIIHDNKHICTPVYPTPRVQNN